MSSAAVHPAVPPSVPGAVRLSKCSFTDLPYGVNLMALLIRLMMTCCSRRASAMHSPAAATAGSTCSSMAMDLAVAAGRTRSRQPSASVGSEKRQGLKASWPCSMRVTSSVSSSNPVSTEPAPRARSM